MDSYASIRRVLLSWLPVVLLGCCCCSFQRSSVAAVDAAAAHGADELDCNSPGRNSFMWKIHREPPAYLLGTIHVPYTAVWASLSPTVLLALRSVHTAHFELDLTRQATLDELARCQLIEDAGTRLEDLISHELVERISSYLSEVSRRLSDRPQQQSVFAALTANWRRRRPMWLALSLASLTPHDLAQFGTEVLDVRLMRLARLHGQRVLALESVSDQCEPLNSVPLDEATLAVNLTLAYLEEQLTSSEGTQRDQQSPETELVRSYRCGGDLAALMATKASSFLPQEAVAQLSGGLLTTYRRLVRRLRRWLSHRRNRRMAGRVAVALAERPGEAQLFAVGIGHLLGNEDSIVHHLRVAGFKVEQLAWNDTDPSLRAINPAPTVQRTIYNDNRESESQRAAAEAEREIWEKAKKFARLKWLQLKATEDQYAQSPSPRQYRQHEPSVDVIKSAVTIEGNSSMAIVVALTLLYCRLVREIT